MGWLLINICLPILAPLGMYLVFNCIPLPRVPRKRINPLLAVKDGQLCWAAIGFCASGMREVYGKAGTEWILGILVLVLVLSSLLACGGALFQTSIREVRRTAWFSHYRCFIGSLMLTVCAAALYVAAHFKN